MREACCGMRNAEIEVETIMRGDFSPLPATDGDAPKEQLRLACTELDRRVRAGEHCPAEQLLAAFPEIASHKDSALELIYTEFVLRHQLGQQPSPEEWYARFPQWQNDLQELFQVHHFVTSGVENNVATLLPA